MAQSMTAYGRAESAGAWGLMICELRSVNHRHLEPHFRLAEGLRALEPTLRTQLREAVRRGKVDCFMRIEDRSTAAAPLQLNAKLAEQVAQHLVSLQQSHPQLAQASASDVLHWPGVLQPVEPDVELLHDAASELFGHTLKLLQIQRYSEGERLGKLIGQRIDALRGLIEHESKSGTNGAAHWRANLIERINDLQISLDPARLEQEVALLAQKADTSEELERLAIHCDAVQQALHDEAPSGRRLDFLMQELNREANTLGAKASSSATSHRAVEMKVIIEQMREQVQNLE